MYLFIIAFASLCIGIVTVSYTHLDVYKRQAHGIPVFMKEDLLPIMGDERMIQELPEQFTRRIQ